MFMTKTQVQNQTAKTAGKVWVNRFDNYKRAQAFARENDAKVERTGDSVMKYRVVTVGVHN
jgi:hypothetical protein